MTGKIITVTPHTAIDLRLRVSGLRLGDTACVDHVTETAAGKGLNVAKTLVGLGQSVQAIAWVGEESLTVFNALQSIDLKGIYLPVAGKTRTNITLFDSEIQQETHLRTPGFTVTAADCERLRRTLAACVAQNDIVILAGSLPAAAPVDLYRQLTDLCQHAGATVFLDSSGDGLKHGLKATPFLIKPNQHELEQYLDKSLKNKEEIVCAARDILATGVSWVIVSRAEQGAIFVSDTAVYEARVAAEPKTIIRQVGCGDALLAGFAWASLRGETATACIQTALACGTANLFAEEAGNISWQQVNAIKPRVVVKLL